MEKRSPIDQYLEKVNPEKIEKLLEILSIIRKAIPEAEEVISYGMPAFKYGKILVYFAEAKNHIGFYPTPSAITNFKEELAPYKHSKGAVQFQTEEKLPAKLITAMCKFRLTEEKKKMI